MKITTTKPVTFTFSLRELSLLLGGMNMIHHILSSIDDTNDDAYIWLTSIIPEDTLIRYGILAGITPQEARPVILLSLRDRMTEKILDECSIDR